MTQSLRKRTDLTNTLIIPDSVEAHLREFETAGAEGPSVEQVFERSDVCDLDEFDQDLLLFELIKSELAEKHELGKHPRYQDFVDRFPRDDDLLERAFLAIPDPNPSQPRFAKLLDFDATLEGERILRAGEKQYEIVCRIDGGGYGTVWKARDRSFSNRTVAIKVPHHDLVTTPEERDNAMREGHILAQLEHDNIVRVHSVVPTDSRSFGLVMEYCEGHPLKTVIDDLKSTNGPRTFKELSRCVDILKQVVSGLGFIHDRGWRHCDLKAQNIVLDNDVVKIIDFGLALHSSEQLKQKDGYYGTIWNFSPEHASGSPQSFDNRTDLFCFGIIAYELLTGGQHPFLNSIENNSRSQLEGTILQCLSKAAIDANSIRIHNDFIPVELEQIVLRCLEKKKLERPSLANDVSKSLLSLKLDHALEPATPIGGHPKRDTDDQARQIGQSHLSIDQGSFPPLPHYISKFFFHNDAGDPLPAIESALADDGMLALAGPSGTGKTLTAVQFAHSRIDRYRFQIWLPAEDRQDLLAAFSKLAKPLGLSSHLSEKRLIEDVRTRLTDEYGWLIIFDNVLSFHTIEEFLPTVKRGGHILLTTTEPIDTGTGTVFSGRYTAMRIGRLSKSDGTRFLLERTGLNPREDRSSIPPDEISAVHEIVDQLDGLPLALEQVAAYMTFGDDERLSFVDYLSLLKSIAVELLSSGTNPTKHAPVVATYEMALRLLTKDNPQAIELLRLCAFMHPDSIPESALYPKHSQVHIEEDIFSNRGEFLRAIRAAARLSLLKRNSSLQSLAIHNLVQLVVRHQLLPDEIDSFSNRALLILGRSMPSFDFGNWQECDRIVPHLVKVFESLHTDAFKSPQVFFGYASSGTYLKRRLWYVAAEKVFVFLKEFLETNGDEESVEYGMILSELAGTMFCLGHTSEARELYQHSFEVFFQLVDSPDGRRVSLKNIDLLEPMWQLSVASCLLKLGDFVRDEGHYQSAEGILTLAGRIITEATVDTTRPHVRWQHSMGLLRRFQGRYSEARDFLISAVNTSESIGDNELPALANCLDDLAGLYAVEEDFSNALTTIDRALSMTRHVHGPNSGDFAICSNNKGIILSLKGDYSSAVVHHRTALSINNTLGRDTIRTAESKVGLARALTMTGDLAEAEELFESGITQLRNAYPDQHPQVMHAVSLRARLYTIKERFSLADAEYKASLKGLTATYGGDHPEVDKAAQNAGDNLLRWSIQEQKRKKYCLAVQLARKGCRYYEGTSQKDSPQQDEWRKHVADLAKLCKDQKMKAKKKQANRSKRKAIRKTRQKRR